MHVDMLKLGTLVKDTASGLSGMLVLMQIDQDNQFYYLQPHGLNDETGQPVKGMWIGEARIKGGVVLDSMPDRVAEALPALGTSVTDKASGFSGKAIAIILHLNGCVHIEVQPQGLIKHGDPVAAHDFDIRRLEGRAIVKKSEAQIKREDRETPGPIERLARQR